jgi:hypothetical protein
MLHLSAQDCATAGRSSCVRWDCPRCVLADLAVASSRELPAADDSLLVALASDAIEQSSQG